MTTVYSWNNITAMTAGIINETFQLDKNISRNNNGSATDHSLMDNVLIQIPFYILYSTIFILGVFGNVLVCYVVFRNKAMQTVTNLFITNLALSDILLCILAVPFTPLYTFQGRWIFGTMLCHLVPYAQGCSVYISTLTLTSIAIDRFFVIIYPFHPRMRLTTCILIIVSIWIFSLLVTLPYGIFMVCSVFSSNSIIYCEEDWPSEKYRQIVGSLTSILQFILPFLIILMCYVCVSMKLNDRAKAKPGSKTSKKEEVDRNRKKRTNLMLISMVAVFGISWMPINVVNIFNDFHQGTEELSFYNLLFFIAHSIAMSSTCYNPFLYAWLNENFRKEFKQVLPFFNPSRSRNYSSSGRERFKSERTTCNGNNDTIQETLINQSSTIRPSIQDILFDGPSVKKCESQSTDSILLSDITNCDNIVLPSDTLVIETPFQIQLTPSKQLENVKINGETIKTNSISLVC